MYTKKMAAPKEKKKCISQFCSITGADKETAKKILEVCKYNVEMAINMHVEAEPSEATPSADSEVASSSPVVADELVRSALCALLCFGTLLIFAIYFNRDSNVRAPIQPIQGVLVETAFASGLRVRQRLNRSIFDGFRDFEAEAREQEQELWNQGGIATSQRRKTLEDLFRPPLDMMHRGSFDSAREAGLCTNKWLMVNIQNVQEFQCQVLNRDVWSNQAVKSIVREHFIFWQVYHDSEEGQRYIQFYKVLDWPYVAIIDPRTGEKMVVWSNIDPVNFCDLVTEFLTAHPSLDGSHVPSPPAKRLKSDSILDASEDSQLEAAIRASLVETTSSRPDSSNSRKRDHISNSEMASTSAGKCQASSDQNSEDEDIEIETFESDSEESCPPSTNKCNDNGSSSVAKQSESENQSDWKQYLGVDEDPKSKLIVRFPDGSRDQLSLPATSKLLALLLYVRSKGFSEEKYELVTNFPRRQLSSLKLTVSLQEAGLYPQETIFVQAR